MSIGRSSCWLHVYSKEEVVYHPKMFCLGGLGVKKVFALCRN